MRGGQWQALRLHLGLLAAGHESVLLAREHSPLLEHPEAKPMRLLEIGRMLRGFDLVHAHDARSHTIAAMLTGVPLVVSRRVAFPVRSSAASRWKYGRPALFLAVSKYVAGMLREAGVSDRRISVVYDGVPVMEVPPITQHGSILLAIDKETGLAREAAKIAGVELMPAPDLAADLPRARGLIYLTNSEGLGSGILMAMAHAVPVIASNVGGIPEIIENGRNGLLVANEPRQIAEAIGKLDSAWGQAARTTVLGRFTEKRMIEATLSAYEQVLAHG